MKTKDYLLVILFCLMLLSCNNDIECPTVVTNEIVTITDTSAVCVSDVTCDGGSDVGSKGVCWSFSQNPTLENNHTNDGSGIGQFTSHVENLIPNTTYYVRAFATNEEGTSYGNELTFTTLESAEDENTINGYEFVNLGLPSGIKWATRNVGAETPEDYGSYYAWGMTTTPPDNAYFPENCNTYELLMDDISGDVQFDAAAANWGGSWRMPSRAEFIELRTYCQWEWTTLNGVNGFMITGTNENNIFLPAAGYRSMLNVPFFENMYGDYWTSTPGNDMTRSSYYFGFDEENYYINNTSVRYDGLTIRAVSE